MTPVEIESEYMNIQEAARYCGASEASIRDRIYRGLLPAKKLVGVLVVAKADLATRAASGKWK